MPGRKQGTSRHKPKLGQNFLVSTTAPRAIVDALGDLSQATVLEIGPGRGALTTLLAARARQARRRAVAQAILDGFPAEAIGAIGTAPR